MAIIDIVILGSELTKIHAFVALGHPLILIPLAFGDESSKIFTIAVTLMMFTDIWAIFYFGK